MTILGFILLLLFIGAAIYVINVHLPKLDSRIRWLLTAALLLIAFLTTLYAFGVWDAVRGARVPHI